MRPGSPARPAGLAPGAWPEVVGRIADVSSLLLRGSDADVDPVQGVVERDAAWPRNTQGDEQRWRAIRMCWRALGVAGSRARAQLSHFQGRCESQSCPDTTCQVSRPRNSSNVYVDGADPFCWLTSGTSVTRLPRMKTAPTSTGSLGRQSRKNCTEGSAGSLWSCTGW